MKKVIKAIALASISTLLLSSAAFAASSHTVKITVDCPDICNNDDHCLQVNALNNSVWGYGFEHVNGDTATKPYFVGSYTVGANVPVDLKGNGYSQLGTGYDPNTGIVSCYYESSMGFDPVSASYQLQNALHGVVTFSGVDEIKIKIQTGLTK